ncbi:aminoglycoside phosphotransferase family protein [Hydrocarboniclastica marina]|uniref:Aminoglycoside phosphotransferase n=1 Tax=Hydrocarboniclastica marina TaxID=2259620 RepID=A0A4V1D930_9ALTE|nr:phosphotransferase [Hydrocarboniclastica marina]QCF27260.1 aminoglycoside phosphotransferase [Hydrocarboniclastica marina]
MDNREAQLTAWLEAELGGPAPALLPVAGDASFRRYFRIQLPGTSGPAENGTAIVMDAPPEHESCDAFLAIAQHWHDAGIHVPAVLASDAGQGFILLEDLGDELYLKHLTPANADRLYGDALTALVQIQLATARENDVLPPYSAVLLDREMALFRDWFLQQQLGFNLTTAEQALLDTTFRTLRDAAMAQPQVTVHRDYHSRNLLVTEKNNPGVIDFQDAVVGPLTYDLVSLLRDAYIAWPEDDLQRWVEHYRELSQAAGLHRADADTFRQWFELMGMQRHLKVAGIFSRLSLRDGKDGYLADIPRVIDYLVRASATQPAMRAFTAWLEERVVPEMAALVTDRTAQ